MAKKILIFGATGSVGSSLAKLVKDSSMDAHLVGKNEKEISTLKDQTGFSCSIADVTDPNFIDIIDKDLDGVEISGIAYCVGSIDLKPVNLVSKKDYLKSFELNLFPKVWVEQNFTIAIYLWVFFFIIPLFLIAISTDYIKRRIMDFKSLNPNTRWPLYILLFGVWDLMIGFAYLLFSYFTISHVTMILANGLFITGTYLTFLSFSIARKLQISKKS